MRNRNEPKRRVLRSALAIAAAFCVSAGAWGSASALEKLRVGNPSPEAFSFIPLYYAVDLGIMKKHGLDVEIFGLNGSGKIQQALVAGSIDIAVSSGPELVYVAKGAPEIGIAAVANPPSLLDVGVLTSSPIKTVADLKGKTVAVSTAGSLTEWLVRELSRQQGWGPDGIKSTPLGATTTEFAALKLGQVDAMVFPTGLEEERGARSLINFGDVVKDFHIHVAYATKDMVKDHPDLVRAFLAGWFETVDYMRAHKPEAVKFSAKIMNSSETAAGHVYDVLMPMFSTDNGRFHQKALDTLAQSFIDLHMLPAKPDMHKLYTEEFLPPAPGGGAGK